jgi:signal transduction histidine kinase
MPLLWRVFAGNAAVLLAATLVLVLTPATVSFPVALEELLVLAGGLALMLAVWMVDGPARDAVRAALDDVRAIARRLRPEALDDLGPDEELVVYRVVQEALTNAVRHAGARRASVTLTRTDHAVTLEITDDGQGFDAARAADGAGLRGMRERTLLIGAQLDITAGPAGTEIRVVIET